MPADRHCDYRWEAENLIWSSPYLSVTSHKKLERCNNNSPSYQVNKIFFLIFALDLLPEGLNVCINYEFNLLDHVGVVQKYMAGRTDGQPDIRTDGQPNGRTTREHNPLARFAAVAELDQVFSILIPELAVVPSPCCFFIPSLTCC